LLYWLLFPLRDELTVFNVIRYPSFRIIGAAMTSLLICLLFGKKMIAALKVWQHGVSNVREDTPEQHKKKSGTPSMGGLLILFSLTISTLLWADPFNHYMWTALAMTLGFGAIGFMDDYLKKKMKNSKGLAGKKKLLFQLILLGAGAFFLRNNIDTHLSLPFLSLDKFNPDIGLLYIPFAFIVVMGTSHGVNLTDGLDGLAIGPSIVSAAVFGVLAYAAGSILNDFDIAGYLRIPHIPGTAELAVFCAALAGAGMGFLWFNAYPAEVFMGDVGALAIGGGLGTVAVLTKNEFLSAIIHGLFLAETLSVMLQVGSYKYRNKKRIFKMAPLHHHFELSGWAEQKVVVRFWLISIMLAMAALSTLKLR
jgi:phospho-N-acetylmuramoyl-pentapeptide-transferase